MLNDAQGIYRRVRLRLRSAITPKPYSNHLLRLLYYMHEWFRSQDTSCDLFPLLRLLLPGAGLL